MSPTEINFKSCIVKLYPDHVETLKADGSRSLVYPKDDPSTRAAARACGYRNNYFLYGFEHEILRAFLAEKLTSTYHIDDHLISSFQRYITLGLLDDYGKLDRMFGMELNKIREEAIQLLRPCEVGWTRDSRSA